MKISQPIISLALAFAAVTGWAADTYPCASVKLVSPYPPGGTTDILARMIQPGLTRELGVPVIVENKAGASSNVGTEFVSAAAPDGCTLLLGNNTGVAINRNLYKLRLDPAKALTPVIEVASVPLVLYVNAAVPARTYAELVELLRKNPGKFSYASGGSGSPQHLMGELLKVEAGMHIVHIPYKGQGPAMQDVIGGQVEMAFETTTVIVPQLQGGKIRALATTAASRPKSLPGIPTMKELGMKDFVTENWYGVFAPEKTPRKLVDQLNKVLYDILQGKDVRASLEKMGSSETLKSPDDFRKFIDRELPVWERVVKQSGAKVD
jgi:tripartite-type tricarboxylate transporter receptor subunit TctC